MNIIKKAMKKSINAYGIRAEVPGKSWLTVFRSIAADNEANAIGLLHARFGELLTPDHVITVKHILVHHITDVLRSDSYPYGRLRTTAAYRIEYVSGKGARSVFQTVNPKTGKPNAEKKSTYGGPSLPCTNVDNGHFDSIGVGMNGANEINACLWFMNDFNACFDASQIEDIALALLAYTKAHAKATVIYTGAKWEDIKQYFETPWTTLAKIAKTGEPMWTDALIDEAGIKAHQPEGYNPFKVSAA